MNKLIQTAAIGILVVAAIEPVGRAQTEVRANHPDFSGTWAVDIRASTPGVVLDGVQAVQPFDVTPPTTLHPTFANGFVARQDGSTLSVQRIDRQNVATSLTVVYYRLDGSESTNVEGGMTTTASTATWQNSTLTIVTSFTDAGSLLRRTLKRVMSMDANGRLLVETTVPAGPTYLTAYRRIN
jgi:hypothetical protein